MIKKHINRVLCAVLGHKAYIYYDPDYGPMRSKCCKRCNYYQAFPADPKEAVICSDIENGTGPYSHRC